MSLPNLDEIRSNVPFSTVQLATYRHLLAERGSRADELQLECSAARLLLNAATDRQKENQKAVDVLMAVFAPIRRVPEDVLVKIFDLCIDVDQEKDPSYSTLHSSRCPLLLTHVCAYWRRLVLCTPLLWSRVSFRNPAPSTDIEVLQVIFNRSSNLPLRVNVLDAGASENVHRDILAKIMTLNLANFMARLETLELGCSTEIFHTAARAFPKHTFTISGGIVTSQTPRFPALRKLILGTVGLQGHWYEPSVFRLFENSPLLRSLTFGSTTLAFNHGRHLAAVVWPINEDVPWSQITELNVSGWVDFPTMLALLQACKNLGNLTLGQIIEKNQYRPLSDEAHHVLTALHTLTLSISHREAGDFVSFITTPALRHLTIISYGYKDQDTKVMELCQRSHFRLETLEIHGDYPLQSMLDLLKGNPNIWRLHLIEVCDQDVIGYLQNGKVVHEEDSPSAAATLLPHLRELSITLEHGKESRNGEKYLRRILRSQVRATSLEYAKVVVGRKTWEARGENIRVRAEEVEYNDS